MRTEPAESLQGRPAPADLSADSSAREEDFVELLLLLSGRQLAQLESAAGRQGVTVGEVLRRLIRTYLARFPVEKQPAAEAGAAARGWFA